jgi:hypothetical protein
LLTSEILIFLAGSIFIGVVPFCIRDALTTPSGAALVDVIFDFPPAAKGLAPLPEMAGYDFAGDAVPEAGT